MKKTTVDILASYVEALYPIIYINHFDFKVIDEAIADINKNTKIFEFNNAFGLVNSKTKSPMLDGNLETFLNLVIDEGFENETFIVLKDVHSELNSPKIISLLRKISENNLYNENYHATIFILSDILVIPKELENYITIYDFPLPTIEDIISIIKSFIIDLDIKVDQDTIEYIAIAFKGLSEFQIKQILNLAYQNGGNITKEDKQLILKEKEQLIKKSGRLEIVNFKETLDDIGGLENLKDWLRRKEKIFSQMEKATRFGVDMPKGLLITGIPGCGKSLTAKATASLFAIPLVRLDVGRLLGKYVGESESNMRKALKLAEAISPCVLWIDEIEKAFSGIGTSDSGHEVTKRLFGQFLTWMQEKENTVFTVATANDSSKMPPELLRKGRFDEIFFIDLPNEKEREHIIEIHLKKRNKYHKRIYLDSLAEKTEGFSGADLEAAINDTIESAFIEGKGNVSTEDILEHLKQTKSISLIKKKDIEAIHNSLKESNFKSASKDIANGSEAILSALFRETLKKST